MKYDVLTEPWITVVTLDGKTEETGIRGFFEKAHLYRDVVFDSPLEKRLICTGTWCLILLWKYMLCSGCSSLS